MMRYSHFAFVVLAAGCVSNAEWERRTGFQPAPVKPTDPVLIWSNATVEKWHGVILTADSVSGIPYETSLECDSCRRSIPLVLVDSMKVRHPTDAKTVLVITGVVAAAYIVTAAVCRLLDPGNTEC
jgi:hypothetical protein